MEGVAEPESGDDIPIKMLDCDSITQAKEKVIDALYKNCPASKRPQLTQVDLSKCRACNIDFVKFRLSYYRILSSDLN